MKLRSIIELSFVILPAILIGASGYTFYYARGYSYLVDDPKACINCHVMRDNYVAWEISSHRSVGCNGCHVPQHPIRMYLVKAENGFRHSYVFTFENPQVIRLAPIGQRTVEANCIRCHESVIAATPHGGKPEGRERCFDCHRGVGHAF
jgi:cytochrome c nitrite reductase small subunit